MSPRQRRKNQRGMRRSEAPYSESNHRRIVKAGVQFMAGIITPAATIERQLLDRKNSMVGVAQERSALLDASQFDDVELIVRKLLGQPSEQDASRLRIFIAQSRDGQQQPRKWRQIVSFVRGKTEPLQALFLVGLRASHAKD